MKGPEEADGEVGLCARSGPVIGVWAAGRRSPLGDIELPTRAVEWKKEKQAKPRGNI